MATLLAADGVPLLELHLGVALPAQVLRQRAGLVEARVERAGAAGGGVGVAGGGGAECGGGVNFAGHEF